MIFNNKKTAQIASLMVAGFLLTTAPARPAEAFGWQDITDTVSSAYDSFMDWLFTPTSSTTSESSYATADYDTASISDITDEDGFRQQLAEVGMFDAFEESSSEGQIDISNSDGSQQAGKGKKKKKQGEWVTSLSDIDKSQIDPATDISMDINSSLVDADLAVINGNNDEIAMSLQTQYDALMGRGTNYGSEEDEEYDTIADSLADFAVSHGISAESLSGKMTSLLGLLSGSAGAMSLMSSTESLIAKKEEEESETYNQQFLAEAWDGGGGITEEGEASFEVNDDGELVGQDGYRRYEQVYYPTYTRSNYTALPTVDHSAISNSLNNMPKVSAKTNPIMMSVIKQQISEKNEDWSGESLDRLSSYIISKANEYNINPFLICAQLQQESCFNPSAQSSAGACGIAQFMPETAAGYGIDPWSVTEAIDAQCQYVSRLKKMFGDDALALAGYNAGEGNVSEYNGIPPFAETQNYVKSISSIISSMTNRYNLLLGKKDGVEAEA